MTSKRFTKEDIDFLREHYPIGDWDAIMKRFLGRSKSSINHKVSRLNIRFEGKKIQKVKNNHIKWTQEEDDFLIASYSYFPIEYVETGLPKRSRDAIILRASMHKLPSFTALNMHWTEAEKNYIRDNWKTKSDYAIGIELGKTQHAVKRQRHILGLFRFDKFHKSYPNITKYLRGQNQKWKNESMKACDYKCVLTGSKDFEIHHLYSVSSMVNEIIKEYGICTKESFSDYTDDELSFILEKFLEKQAQYPLGVCVDKKIHTLFHSVYGQYCNTPEQWYCFVEDYKKGVYDNYNC